MYRNELGVYSEAQLFYERALSLNERVLGKDHFDTGRSIHNLVGVLRTRGNLVNARSYQERALAIIELLDLITLTPLSVL